MQTRSASRSPEPMPIVQHDDQHIHPTNKISAYYSLVFPHFTFYIQTLSVTIGRRVVPSTQAASSSSAADPVQVDVDLGALKSVSRLHAKIEYDQEQDRFVLQVIGRNGAWVDGVWQGSGTRAPLGERSQIQIASRIFHFVLPPPPPPEDTPSPSEHSDSHSPLNNTSNRARSPSLDITSISPPSSLPDPPEDPPVKVKPPTPPPPAAAPAPALGPPAVITTGGKSSSGSKPSTSKKRKKSDSAAAIPPPPRPKPEEMPPKPSLTYAQLIFRAIKALDGKATLQEICNWITKEYEYYRYVEDDAWRSSIRHNLSSGRAFKKMERCGGDRGKGFFWSLDEAHLHTLEEQDARMEQEGGKGKKKEKGGAALSEPPLKRSVKDAKGAALPPPLTSKPLVKAASKTTPVTSTVAVASTSGGDKASGTSQSPTVTTGVFSYQQIGPNYAQTSLSSSNPYAVLTQGPWGMHGKYPHHNPYIQHPHPPPHPHTQQNSPPVGAPLSPQTSTSGLATVPPPPPTTTTSTSISTTTTTAVPTVSSPPPTAASPPIPVPTKTTVTAIPATQQPQTDVTPSIPFALESVVVPIVIGLPPNASAAPSTTKHPPMVVYDSKIYLDPEVFNGLSKDMLDTLEKLGASKAIQFLTSHMTRVLKERESLARKKKKEKKEKREKKKDKEKRGKGKDGAGETTTATATTAMEVDTAVTQAVPAATIAAPERPESPIIIIDDDDDDSTRRDEEPAPKRRKVDASESGAGPGLSGHGLRAVPVS